jgi:hypothetical protein
MTSKLEHYNGSKVLTVVDFLYMGSRSLSQLSSAERPGEAAGRRRTSDRPSAAAYREMTLKDGSRHLGSNGFSSLAITDRMSPRPLDCALGEGAEERSLLTSTFR